MNLPKPMSKKTALVFLVALGLLTRLPFLGWFTTEITDGVLNLNYFKMPVFDIPRFVLFPGFPALLFGGAWFGLPAELWGRLLAALFSLAVLWPLWRLARRWASVEISFLMCLAYLLSPLGWMWSLRLMGDTLFIFLLWWSIERTLAWEEKTSLVTGLWALTPAFASFVVRPEGTLLLVFCAVVFWKERRMRFLALTGLGLAVILMLASPMRFLFLHSFGAFQEGAMGMEEPWTHWIGSFWVYLTQPAWVFTPILFFLAVGGVFEVYQDHDGTGRFWRRKVFVLLGVMLLLKMVPTNYQDRHLLPFLPAACLLAALKLQTLEKAWAVRHSEMGVLLRRNTLALGMLGFLVVFSAAVWDLQKDSFGDFCRNAQYLKTLPTGAVIYSDEQFKTEYLSQREVRVWSPSIRDIHPGDYMVFHSFSTPRWPVLEQTLRRHFVLELIQRDQAYEVPILTDLMMDPSLQNRVQATSHRFEPQYFETVLYQVVRTIPKFQDDGWD